MLISTVTVTAAVSTYSADANDTLHISLAANPPGENTQKEKRNECQHHLHAFELHSLDIPLSSHSMTTLTDMALRASAAISSHPHTAMPTAGGPKLHQQQLQLQGILSLINDRHASSCVCVLMMHSPLTGFAYRLYTRNIHSKSDTAVPVHGAQAASVVQLRITSTSGSQGLQREQLLSTGPQQQAFQESPNKALHVGCAQTWAIATMPRPLHTPQA